MRKLWYDMGPKALAIAVVPIDLFWESRRVGGLYYVVYVLRMH